MYLHSKKQKRKEKKYFLSAKVWKSESSCFFTSLQNFLDKTRCLRATRWVASRTHWAYCVMCCTIEQRLHSKLSECCRGAPLQAVVSPVCGIWGANHTEPACAQAICAGSPQVQQSVQNSTETLSASKQNKEEKRKRKKEINSTLVRFKKLIP